MAIAELVTDPAGEPVRRKLHSELVESARVGRRWDGRDLSYVPDPEPAATGVPMQTLTEAVDPVTYQVLRWKLWSLNLEHTDTIKKVSGSPVIVYMDDLNTSILTENGDNLVCGPSIQYFTGLADLVVKWTLENRSRNPGIHAGDVFLQNDPYIGTAHQLDTALFAPVFWQGELFSWVFSSCHQGDLGGSTPGGFCVGATDMFDETTPVPPIKLVHSGDFHEDVVEMFMRKSRHPHVIALQLRSQIAGLHATSQRLLELLETHGAPQLKWVMRRIISDCSEAVGRRLRSIPDGQWSEAFYAGSLTPTDRLAHRIQMTVTKTGDQLICSNEGTDPQIGAANCTYASWRSGTVSALSTALAHDQLFCPAGVIDHLQFDPTPGTINCASYPAAVTTLSGTLASIALAGQIVGKMLLSGPPALQEMANASCGASMIAMVVVAGTDTNGNFVADVPGDSMAEGMGAFSRSDGVDNGGAWFVPRTLAGDVEEWELHLPMLYLYRKEEADSGGPGQYRGGNGITSALVGHKGKDATVQVVSSDGAVNMSPGLAGAGAGRGADYFYFENTAIQDLFARSEMPADQLHLEALKRSARIHPKGCVNLGASDVTVLCLPAGGGFGDPLQRDPDAVGHDVREGSLSRLAAEANYGVVVDADFNVAEAETQAARARLLDARRSQSYYPPDTARDSLPDSAPLRGIAGALAVGAIGNEAQWACSACRAVLGPITTSYKSLCAFTERPPHEVDALRFPRASDFCDDVLVLREYFCPVCFAVVSSEFTKEGTPPLFDIKLDPDAVIALLANDSKSEGER